MDIEHWRKEIDEVDKELLRLLNMRARLAIKIGGLKRSAGLPLRDLERERFVIEHLANLNTGPLDLSAISRLFRRIMRESRRIETLSEQHPNGAKLSTVDSASKLRGIA